MSVSLQTLARERGTTYTADTPSTENRRSSWTGTSPEHLARVFSLKLRAATGLLAGFQKSVNSRFNALQEPFLKETVECRPKVIDLSFDPGSGMPSSRPLSPAR